MAGLRPEQAEQRAGGDQAGSPVAHEPPVAECLLNVGGCREFPFVDHEPFGVDDSDQGGLAIPKALFVACHEPLVTTYVMSVGEAEAVLRHELLRLDYTAVCRGRAAVAGSECSSPSMHHLVAVAGITAVAQVHDEVDAPRHVSPCES